MVEACRPFIEAGAVTLFTLDSVDRQSWLNEGAPPAERARRHNDYDRYVVEEAAPFIRGMFPGAAGFLATGCSMGGYHSANFFFRHPDIFDALIALSGVYKLSRFIGEYMDENVYFNNPLDYLPGMNDDPIGTRDMFSTPAAMTTSYAPAITPWAAKCADCCDEPH